MNNIISSTPHMDSIELELFQSSIHFSNQYLEYGSGGSTVYACNEAKVPKLISVDSSEDWVTNVKQSLNRDETGGCAIIYQNIGNIGEWGVPTDTNNFSEYWKYIISPWEIAKANNFIPDLILIDGRFRVASFLYSLLCARKGTKILFDDYLNRPEYFVVEKYCKLHDSKGRMGIFITDNYFEISSICAEIAKYSVIWD